MFGKEKELRGRRPKLSLVVSLLALVVAMSGTAYAATIAPKNSVVSRSIKNAQVKTADLAPGGVTSAKVRDGAVKAPDIAPESVGGGHLAPIIQIEAVSPATADADGVTNGGMNGIAEATATCPSGTTMLSGGALWGAWSFSGNEGENVYLQSSHRFGNGWRARGIVDMGAQGTVRLRVLVTCLSDALSPN